MSWLNVMVMVPLPYAADDTAMGTSRTVMVTVSSADSLAVSVAANVNVMSWLDVTPGAVNCGRVVSAPVKSTDGPESLVHAYVRASPSRSRADPDSVTGSLSLTVRSGPASAVGGRLFFTVIVSESATVCGPAVTVRVKVNAVSPSTGGATNVVGGKLGLLRETAGEAESCDHEYVRVSSSGSLAVHGMLTVVPSLTVWSGPTLTVGLRFCVVVSRMVRVIVSSSEVVPSSTVRVRVIGVSAVTEDAVTWGVAEVRSSKDSLESCDHEYVRLSLSISVPDPGNVMDSPSSTDRSGPAFATGALLVVMPSCTVTVLVTCIASLPAASVQE